VRDILKVLAFGVVGVSLVLQGLTMRPPLRRLGLASTRQAVDEDETVRAHLRAVEGALAALAQAHETGDVGSLQYERLCNAPIRWSTRSLRRD
jgi:hypothetical protein